MCYNCVGDNMKVQKIEKLKNKKYKITIDNKTLITFDNVILENNLLYNKIIDDKLYDKILRDTEFYNIYDKIEKYVLKKRRSEKEAVEYLLKLEISGEYINKIINKLKNNNLINDIEYCRAFINDNIYLSKYGINKIKIELLKQNISIQVIENELSNIDNELIYDKLQKLILKKIKSNNKHSNVYFKQKILNEMINLGYDKDDILTILENNLIDNPSIPKKEYEKIYKKLSIKYSGVELTKNIKVKMLQKGFDLETINNLLQEKTED